MINYVYESDSFNLRALTLDDAERYFESMEDSNTKRGFINTPNDIGETKKEIQEKISELKKERPTKINFAIEVDGKYAGNVGVHDMHKQFFDHKCSLDFCLHPEFRGKGIIVDSVKFIIEYIFDKFQYVVRIEGWCRDYNKGSIDVMRKAGLKHEGTLHKNLYVREQYLNDMVFAIVR